VFADVCWCIELHRRPGAIIDAHASYRNVLADRHRIVIQSRTGEHRIVVRGDDRRRSQQHLGTDGQYGLVVVSRSPQ